MVTRLGLGGASLGGLYKDMPDETAVATVRRALELGVNFIDTAPLYGHGKSELRLGRALAGQPRDSYILATKVGRLLEPEGPSKATISRVPLNDGRFVDLMADGRYLDVLERRDGVWKISYRHLVSDGTRTHMIDRIVLAGDRPPPPPSSIARPNKDDPSYRGFDIVDLKPDPFSSGDLWSTIRAQFAES